jgi:hypothetical protein
MSRQFTLPVLFASPLRPIIVLIKPFSFDCTCGQYKMLATSLRGGLVWLGDLRGNNLSINQ